MSDRRPYDRLPGETAKAYAAFSLYRDMGIERSVDAVSKVLGKSTVFLCRWSSKYEWVERAEAWDIDQDYERQKEAIAAKREEYRRNLAEFQKNHLAVGKMAFKATKDATKQIMDFVETNQVIKTLDDANKMANVIKGLSVLSEFWGRALAVDRLLERLESDDD
jgi:hypothetical protein